MATITERRNSKGVLTGWKVTACVGREENTYKQIWKTTTIRVDDDRITETTPKKLAKQVKRLADEWGDQAKEEYEKDRAKQSGNKTKDKMTLNSFIQSKWLPLHVRNGKHAPTTTAFYENMARDITDYFSDKVLLSKVDGEAIEQYQIDMRTKLKTKQGKSYSETTIRRHLETLRNILQYAKTHKYIKANPFEEVRITTTKKEEDHIDFLAPAEAAAFIDSLSSESLFWQCFMRILLYCGLRRGECTALQWGDLDTDARKITIRRNCTVDKNSKAGFSVGSTKSGKTRVVYPTETIMKLLDAFKAEQKEKYGEIQESWFVFCNPTDPSRPIYPTTATTWLSRFMKKHNMRQISPHDLRHSSGTLSKMAGVDKKDTQVFLGHSDSKTTDRYYISADDDSQRNIGKAIEALIEKAH